MNVKKTSIVILGSALLILSGCGTAPSSTNSSGSNGGGGSGSAKAIELSASAGLPANNPSSKAMDLFAKRVGELSNGTVKVKVFYDNQIGDPTSLVKGLQEGTVDICATGDSYYSGIVPQIQVFELPFLFNSYDSARKAIDGPVGTKVLSMFDGKGIKAINFWEIGFRHLTNNVRPIKEPSDLKGVKLRTLPAPVQVKTWELLGALPTPMDFSEIYTSLQQGVIDGQENPLNNITSAKFYEVQKYMSLTGHVYTPMLFAMSQKTWDKLSEEQRKAITTAAKEAQENERSLVKDGESNDLAEIENHGVKVEKQPDIAAFKEISKGAYKVYTDKYGDDLVNQLLGSK